MAEHQPSKNNRKQKGRRKVGKRLSPVTKRILALILTGVFLCSGVVLVVYRDHFNLDALKRHMTYRSLEKDDQGSDGGVHLHPGRHQRLCQPQWLPGLVLGHRFAVIFQQWCAVY